VRQNFLYERLPNGPIKEGKTNSPEEVPTGKPRSAPKKQMIEMRFDIGSRRIYFLRLLCNQSNQQKIVRQTMVSLKQPFIGRCYIL